MLTEPTKTYLERIQSTPFNTALFMHICEKIGEVKEQAQYHELEIETITVAADYKLLETFKGFYLDGTIWELPVNFHALDRLEYGDGSLDYSIEVKYKQLAEIK